jgi:hypothetical protein
VRIEMLDASIQVLLYGLLAGLSALAFAATLAVMPGGRLKTFGFGAGFVGAQALTCSVFVTLGVAAAGSGSKSHPGVRAALALALAVALIALAVRVRRRPPNANPRPSSNERSGARTQAVLERLGRLRFLTTFVGGLVLGVGGPKRLMVTSLAATTIVTAGVGDADKTVLIVVYVTLATALVWGPAVVFLLFGKRVIALMRGAEGEIARRQPQVTVYALLVLAALLVIDALGILLT